MSNNGAYDSRTEAQDWSTAAARIGKAYEHDAPVSANPDKSSARTEDGHVSSHEYIRKSRFLKDRAASRGPAR